MGQGLKTLSTIIEITFKFLMVKPTPNKTEDEGFDRQRHILLIFEKRLPTDSQRNAWRNFQLDIANEGIKGKYEAELKLRERWGCVDIALEQHFFHVLWKFS